MTAAFMLPLLHKRHCNRDLHASRAIRTPRRLHGAPEPPCGIVTGADDVISTRPSAAARSLRCGLSVRFLFGSNPKACETAAMTTWQAKARLDRAADDNRAA